MTRFDLRGSLFDSSGYQPIEESLDYQGTGAADGQVLVSEPVGQNGNASRDNDALSSSELDWNRLAGLFFSSGGFGPQGSGGFGPQGYGAGGSGAGGSGGGLGSNPRNLTPGGSGNGGGGRPLFYGGGGGCGGGSGYGLGGTRS